MEQLTAAQRRALFGVPGDTIEECAARSTQLFVRSQDELAIYSAGATGLILTATQVSGYPAEKLVQILEYGSAVLPDDKSEPSRTLREQRQQLKLEVGHVARSAGVSEKVVHAAESENTRTGIHDLVKIARALALDEVALSAIPGAGRDLNLAVRLRSTSKLTPKAVIDLSEAAWIIRQSLTFQPAVDLDRFERSAQYGHPGYPAWMHGQYLARRTREILGLGQAPIPSLRELVEGLGIPLVHLSTYDRVAGATIANAGKRGIVANLEGDNRNPCVRRFTIAHELGHLLWDPVEQLQSLRVDSYDEIATLSKSQDGHDSVESRANAFAIEFLAPAAEVVRIWAEEGNSPDGTVQRVMKEFGISFTAAQHHVRNSVGNVMGHWTLVFSKSAASGEKEPNEWNAAEDPAYFPIKGVKESRRGDFARVVVRAEQAGRIHGSLAASWLGATIQEYQKNKDAILGLGR